MNSDKLTVTTHGLLTEKKCNEGQKNATLPNLTFQGAHFHFNQN